MAGAAAALLGVLVLLGLQRPAAGRELKFVNLIYRHGDRSPIHTYPADPYTEKDWPQGFAQLTQVGMKQHYALGQYLRHRYNTFLNSSYDRHEVYVQSTDIDRTLMSAQVNLAGLYPPQGDQIFHPDLKWQPIPVHTVPVEQDKFLKFPQKNCPRYQKLLEETMNSREVREKIQKNTDFLNMISNNTKMKVTIQNEWEVYDTLFCEKAHNFTLPSWATHEVLTHMGELNDFGMEILFQLHKTQEKSRLQGGVLLKRILQNINQAINESTPMSRLKLIMYSANRTNSTQLRTGATIDLLEALNRSIRICGGRAIVDFCIGIEGREHDVTIVALQMALNVYNYIIPPYASCFMFELYEEDDRSFTLDMYFRNQSDSEPYLLTLPNCLEHCPLQDFIRITKHLIADNWDEECKISGDSNPTGLVLGVVLSVCCVLLIVLGITLYWRWNWKTSRLQVPTSSDELV